MKAIRVIVRCSVVVMICCAVSLAQSSDVKTQHYTKDGISFEYSSGWILKDSSNQLAQHLLLARAGSSTLIMVLAYRVLVTSSEELAEGRRDVTERFIEDAKHKLGSPAVEVKSTPAQISVGNDVADGVRLQGSVNAVSTTAEVYSYLGKLRFINLAYIRADKDSAQDDAAWSTVLRTLDIAVPLIGSKEFGGQRLMFVGEKLNGRAISLPKPEYPIAARQGGAQGIVTVQVIVDEKGNVAEVLSVSGHPFLVKAAARAAWGAKFTPTRISGQAVRVTGVITYNFMGR